MLEHVRVPCAPCEPALVDLWSSRRSRTHTTFQQHRASRRRSGTTGGSSGNGQRTRAGRAGYGLMQLKAIYSRWGRFHPNRRPCTGCRGRVAILASRSLSGRSVLLPRDSAAIRMCARASNGLYSPGPLHTTWGRATNEADEQDPARDDGGIPGPAWGLCRWARTGAGVFDSACSRRSKARSTATAASPQTSAFRGAPGGSRGWFSPPTQAASLYT